SPPCRSRPSFVSLLAMTIPESTTRPSTNSRTRTCCRLVPMGCLSLRGQDKQKPAVVVIGGEDIGHCLGRKVALGVDRDALAQRSHSPLQRGLDRIGLAVAVGVRLGTALAR